MSHGRNLAPIEIYAGTLVRLHKKLKGDDWRKAKEIAERTGDSEGLNPPMVIDFETVTSIQKDFKDGGTVIMDAKTACVVSEPLEEVLDAWIQVKNWLNQ